MRSEDRNVAERRPEIVAMEAALAELTPTSDSSWTDQLKDSIRDKFDDIASSTSFDAEKVSIPLSRYIRIARFNAAVGGLLCGLFLGAIVGGFAIYSLITTMNDRPPVSERELIPRFGVHAALEQILLEDPAFHEAWADRIRKRTKD